jgi:hypothetical protein
VSSIAALSLALVFQGSAHGDAVEAVLQALMLRGEADLSQPGGRLMCLALGLLFLHRQAAVDATLEVRTAGAGREWWGWGGDPRGVCGVCGQRGGDWHNSHAE